MRLLIAFFALVTSGVAMSQDITDKQYRDLREAVSKGACPARPEHVWMAIREIDQDKWYLHGAAALSFLRDRKFPEYSIFDLAMHYCVELPKPLGRIDKWRYESCMSDAAKAPTAQGVNAGLRVCREKFGQQ